MTAYQANWRAVALLGLCSFLMIMIEFAPIGLLSFITQDLQTSPQIVGMAVTIYVLTGAIFGLITSLYLTKIHRKKLLIVVFIILSIANIGIAKSIDISILLIFRALGAIGHGIFWSIAADYAMRLVPIQQGGRATSIVFGGISLGTVLGAPFMNYLGELLGWRAVFLLCALLGFLLIILLYLLLPSQNTQQNAMVFSFKSLKQMPQVILLIVATGLVAIFNFASYTYIEPYFSLLIGQKVQWIPILFLLFGVSGVIGNLFCLKYMDRNISRLNLFALIGSVISFAALAMSDINFIFIILLMLCIWSMSISILFAALQTWIIQLSGTFSSASSALASAILNCGIAIGSFAGALLIKPDNFSWIFLFSSVIALATLILVALVSNKLIPKAIS